MPLSDSEMSSMFVYEISRNHVSGLQQLIGCPCFSHAQTQSSESSESHSSALRFSGTLFMYSSIMSREISSPWSAHANPSPFPGERGPVLSQCPFLCERAGPSSLSACHSSRLQPAITTALECENLKTKRLPKEPFETCCKMSKFQRA